MKDSILKFVVDTLETSKDIGASSFILKCKWNSGVEDLLQRERECQSSLQSLSCYEL